MAGPFLTHIRWPTGTRSWIAIPRSLFRQRLRRRCRSLLGPDPFFLAGASLRPSVRQALRGNVQYNTLGFGTFPRAPGRVGGTNRSPAPAGGPRNAPPWPWHRRYLGGHRFAADGPEECPDLEEPAGIAWDWFDRAKPFARVDRVELPGNAQTREFAVRYEIRDDHLLQAVPTEGTERIRYARANADSCDGGYEPAILQGEPSRDVRFRWAPASPNGRGGLHALTVPAQLAEIASAAKALVPERSCGSRQQQVPRQFPGGIKSAVDVPTDGCQPFQVGSGWPDQATHRCYCTAMRRTLPFASDFDPGAVPAPHRTGAVDWTRFNANFKRLMATRWQEVNRGVRYPLSRPLLRFMPAFAQQRRAAILDLEGKTRALAKLKIRGDSMSSRLLSLRCRSGLDLDRAGGQAADRGRESASGRQSGRRGQRERKAGLRRDTQAIRGCRDQGEEAGRAPPLLLALQDRPARSVES